MTQNDKNNHEAFVWRTCVTSGNFKFLKNRYIFHRYELRHKSNESEEWEVREFCSLLFISADILWNIEYNLVIFFR